MLTGHIVAAGGGSRLFYNNGLFVVGPESAGAYPGPACYGHGGPLTITDANFFLGRILPDYFARPLDGQAVETKFHALTHEINAGRRHEDLLTPEQVAMGFLLVANAAMTRPIRSLSEGRGFETSAHHLVCFGGAGGQHATAMARDLGIKRVIIHRYSSILSAYGMALADVVVDLQEPESITYSRDASSRIRARFDILKQRAMGQLLAQGFPTERIVCETYLNMRYRGSDTSLMIKSLPESDDFDREFVERHRREFGFDQPREILVDDIRVRGIGQSVEMPTANQFAGLKQIQIGQIEPKPHGIRKVYFEKQGWLDAKVYHLGTLAKDIRLRGPAMVVDETQTIVLDPDSEASILPEHVVIELLDAKAERISTEEIDPVRLSVFGHRFMSVAEQVWLV